MMQGEKSTFAPMGSLTRSKKAAMIVQMLLSDGQKLSLESLPEDQQLRLTHEVASLRLVDRATLAAVAEEFATELEAVGLALPGGSEAAISALDGQISESAMARYREETSRAKGGGDPWKHIVGMEVDTILDIMDSESIEICAVVLSKLPVATAAEILQKLPGDRSRRIAFAVSRTGQITPTAVQRIGGALVDQYSQDVVAAFPTPAGARIGAILNSSQSETRDNILENLAEDDPDFAEEVRKNIFTYPDIPERLVGTDVAKVTRLVDNDDFVTALAFGLSVGDADQKTTEFLLENLSKRMGAQLQEEMAERGKIKRADGEAAQAALITAIRDCAERGEILLIEAEEEDEE